MPKDKKWFKKTVQTSEPDTGMLEWSNQELKTSMINMLRALRDEVDTMQERMNREQEHIVSREMEILRKNQK